MELPCVNKAKKINQNNKRFLKYCVKTLIVIIISNILNPCAPVAQWIEHRIPNP